MAGPAKTLEESTAAVCRMPVDYRARGDISWSDLERQSGYSLHREAITEKLIQGYLRDHPNLVDAWVRHSEDQRSGNWGMIPPEPPKTLQWTVIYYVGRGSELNQDHRFDDPIAACAYFIKRKMEPDPGLGWGTCLGCVIVLAVLIVVALAVRIFVGPLE